MSRYRIPVVEVASRPQAILKGRHGEVKAIGFLGATHLSPKYLVVICRKRKRKKDIITAYFTSDLKKVKGEVVWRA